MYVCCIVKICRSVSNLLHITFTVNCDHTHLEYCQHICSTPTFAGWLSHQCSGNRVFFCQEFKKTPHIRDWRCELHTVN